MKVKEFFLKSKMFSYALILITALGITVFTILNSESFLKVLPLYISLFVMLLNSTANRYGILIGALNSVLYGVVYLQFGLYGSAVSCFAFSTPIQLLAFIRWSKHSYKKTTVFRKLSWKKRICLIGMLIAAYAASAIVLKRSGGQYFLLDALSIPLGLLIPILNLFAYVEYTYAQLLGTLFTIVIACLMIPTVPAQSAYLVYHVYSYVCVIKAFLNVKDIYKEQHVSEISVV